MTLTTLSPLTARDVLSLGVIVNAAANTEKVFFLDDEFGTTHFGHARGGFYADAQGSQMLSSKADIREGFLRVTLRSGFEAFFAIADLVDAEQKQRFAVYDWS